MVNPCEDNCIRREREGKYDISDGRTNPVIIAYSPQRYMEDLELCTHPAISIYLQFNFTVSRYVHTLYTVNNLTINFISNSTEKNTAIQT
jgi:hypothetical protein